MSPERAFVALGSNLGDRRAHLARAVEALAATPGVEVLAVSPWVETDPVGGPPGQGRYLNGVAALASELEPRPLLERLQALERAAGRDRAREPRNGPRTLDLDLLLFGARRLDEPGLTVPHPRMELRAFVLEPLAALAPDLRLPSGRTVAERLAELRAGARAPGA